MSLHKRAPHPCTDSAAVQTIEATPTGDNCIYMVWTWYGHMKTRWRKSTVVSYL